MVESIAGALSLQSSSGFAVGEPFLQRGMKNDARVVDPGSMRAMYGAFVSSASSIRTGRFSKRSSSAISCAAATERVNARLVLCAWVGQCFVVA